ncbi:hypothetical protein NQ315_007141 [Exocentrus adspersus]|uniref:Protein AATF n=1 Tax=Exocentrus adspersus TaxID=1586481 RepID=A0AAV8WDZ0_9CUCU|nr:hypothetical protein NQ315_007141 [Exocentrus adspersus]
MLRKATKETLAEKIAGVLNTTPASFDPEDENIDDTRAKLFDYDEENEEEEVVLSNLRKQKLQLLEDTDPRYTGKIISRKSLGSSDENSESDDESEQEIGEEQETDEENEATEEEGEYADSSDEVDSTQNASEEDENSDDSVDTENILKNDRDFRLLNKTDVSAQHRINCRKKENYVELKKQSGDEFSNQVSTTKDSLTNLLNKLLVLQELMKKTTTKNVSETDDEIPSDTEDEKVSEDDEVKEVPRKKRKLNDLESELSEVHGLYTNYRNTVIKKWDDKTRVATLKSSSTPHSVVNHIEHTLSDRPKLVKRTQLKRSAYTILGQESLVENETNEENVNNVSVPTEEYNTEIFDDDDFYHQLLRELIEVKSADLTDPVQLGRQWIQLQKLRSKMKRKVDTKATKGRKIKYVVHTKLVNFMAPIDDQLWTDQAKTDLFGSLFDKKSSGIS